MPVRSHGLESRVTERTRWGHASYPVADVRQNKTLLNQANAAIVNGDHEGFLAHCTDDVVWIFVGDQTLTGKEAIRRYMKQTYTRPPRFTVDQLLADEEFVTALGHITLADDSGRDVHYAYCDVWRVREGKLAELRAYVMELK